MSKHDCDWCGEPANVPCGDGDWICIRCDDERARKAEAQHDALCDEADRRRKIQRGE